jgi:hypothetical protein
LLATFALGTASTAHAIGKPKPVVRRNPDDARIMPIGKPRPVRTTAPPGVGRVHKTDVPRKADTGLLPVLGSLDNVQRDAIASAANRLLSAKLGGMYIIGYSSAEAHHIALLEDTYGPGSAKQNSYIEAHGGRRIYGVQWSDLGDRVGPVAVIYTPARGGRAASWGALALDGGSEIVSFE